MAEVVHSVKTPSSEEAQAVLEKFYIKWSKLLSDVGVLPQPLRSIAEFVKKEGGGGKKEDERD